MRGSRLLIALLLLATVLVDCVALSLARQPLFSPQSKILAGSLQLSQMSLAAVWLALGSAPGPWRLLGAATVVVLWGWAMAGMHERPSLEASLLMSAIVTLSVCVPLLAARSLGLKIVDVFAAFEGEDAGTGRQRFQFSILCVLGWMTAVAILLSGGKYLGPVESLPRVLGSLWPIGWVFVGFGALALASVWAVLGSNRPILRIAVLIATVLAVTAGPLVIGNGLRFLVPLCMLDVLWLIGSLGVVRVAGYRLTRSGGARMEVEE